jgi:hypothetical protein
LNHLDRALVEAAQVIEFVRPEFLQRIKVRIAEIILVFLVLTVLIGFAIVCWEGVGYAALPPNGITTKLDYDQDSRFRTL